MLVNRMPVYVAFMLFLSTMYGLFFVKEKVMIIRSELSEVKRQINLERDSIHILKAELSYLSSPERLAELNKNILKLNEVQIAQISDDPVCEKQNIERKIILARRSVAVTKWRYKKGHPEYVIKASAKR